MAYLTDLSPDLTVQNNQLMRAIARELGLLPPIPEPQLAMADVTTTIGTSSRDYSTITSWEADLDNGAVYNSSDNAIGECYDDAAFDESVLKNGGGTVGLSAVELTVASGERHDGTAGSGARIVRGSGNHNYIIDLDAAGTISKSLKWLELDADSTSNIVVSVAADDGGHVANMIIHGGSSVGGFKNSGVRTQAIGTGEVLEILNNIIYGLEYADTSAPGYCLNVFARNASHFHHNTCHDYSISHASSTHDAVCIYVDENRSDNYLRNNVATDPSTAGSGATKCFVIPGTTVDGDYNASSDDTADDAGGSNDAISITTANQYVSTTGGSEDLHIQDTDADIYEAGTDLGTTPSGVEVDIDGYDRDAGATTWSIGAHDGNNLRASGAAVPALDEGMLRAGLQQMTGGLA